MVRCGLTTNDVRCVARIIPSLEYVVIVKSATTGVFEVVDIRKVDFARKKFVTATVKKGGLCSVGTV